MAFQVGETKTSASEMLQILLLQMLKLLVAGKALVCLMGLKMTDFK